MAAPIGPGDWVECIDDSPCPWTGDRLLMRGALYCVREVVTHGGYLPSGPTPAHGVRLVGISVPNMRTPHGAESAFLIDRFRPIGGEERMAEPAPVRIREDA